MSVVIKKSSFETLFNKGLSVSEMATELSNEYGIKVVQADVRLLAKSFDINLRKKPRSQKFVAVDDTILTAKTEDVVEGFYNNPKAVVID